MTLIALRLLLPINFKKDPSGRSLVVFSCSLNWEKKISAKLVHSGGLNWIEQFWIKLRPIVDELTENTLYLVCFIFSEDGLNWYVQFVPLVKCCVSYKLLGLLQSNLFQEKLLYELVQVQLKTILTTGYLMATH